MEDDINKPDLIVHSLYIESLKNYNLSSYYNVLTVNDLSMSIESMREAYLITDEYAATVKLTLTPFYNTGLYSGNEPAFTSYEIVRPTKMYKITRNNPRYVIWTKNDSLPICATIVDRIDNWELYEAIQRAKDWVFNIDNYKSIAVFDLDKTLINDQCEKIANCEQLLTYAKYNYDLLVLWSHGSPLHVDEQIEKFNVGNLRGNEIFDLVIKGTEVKSPKNLLSLYNYFPSTIFTRSVLVDDLVANWTPEYTKFLIPFNNKTLKQCLPLI